MRRTALNRGSARAAGSFNQLARSASSKTGLVMVIDSTPDSSITLST